MINILVAEDEERLRRLICSYLKQEGYDPVGVADGEQALERFYDGRFDLIILDVMMPEKDGIEVCSEIRKNSNVPIILLTARNTEFDELNGFRVGADEYITKPFSPRILLSRIAAILKRAGILHNSEITAGNIRIAYREHAVYDSKQRINLTPREYDLIFYFVENRNQVLSREQILSAVWEDDYNGDIRTVDTHVKCLRFKMPSAHEYLKTVRKCGYRLEISP